ncbi:MAG: HD domain-containing protein [Sulfolobales archaeon]
MKKVENALMARNIEPRCVIAAALLHDIGKLSKEYTEKRYFYHNIASTMVCLKVLRHWAKEERSIVAQAVLLHHEERMWRELQKPDAPLIADYYNLIKRKKLKRVNMITNYLEVLDMLGKVMEYLPPANEVFNELSSSLKLSSCSLSPSYESELTNRRLASRFLPLYYLLQLADNRAASAREGLYWRDILNQVAKNTGDDSEEFTNTLMTFGSRSRIFLTLSKI